MPERANTISRSSGDAIQRKRTVPLRILVVDDEPDACEAFRGVLEGAGYSVVSETSARRALERITTQDFDLVLTDVTMAEMNGLDLCRKVVEARPGTPVIVVTGQGNMNTVIEALRIGATDFLTKPMDADSLLGAVARSLRHRAREDASSQLAEDVAGSGSELTLTGVLGQSDAMRQVYQLIARLSGSLVSVLVQGETGTGKERIARALHENSRFKDGPFVALSCAAMPLGLLESELFGHARGSFTDAKSSRKGLFVEANGGTLLLDEIGELPLALQPKLLRAIQERKVRPVGEHQEIPFDCRIIAATNRDLEVEVREKRFREDLYHRINVVKITVPPLRERGDDILLLARHFLERFARRSGRTATMTDAVAEALLGYAWPGNVRELENCMERAVAFSSSDELTVGDLPEKIRISIAQPVLSSNGERDPAVLTLDEVERRHVLGAIRLFGGNKARAAEVLGIDRSTLYRRLAQYQTPGST